MNRMRIHAQVSQKYIPIHIATQWTIFKNPVCKISTLGRWQFYLKLRWILAWKLSQIWIGSTLPDQQLKIVTDQQILAFCNWDIFLVWNLLSFKNFKLYRLKNHLVNQIYHKIRIFLTRFFCSHETFLMNHMHYQDLGTI